MTAYTFSRHDFSSGNYTRTSKPGSFTDEAARPMINCETGFPFPLNRKTGGIDRVSQLRWGRIFLSISLLGRKPTMRSTGWPSLNRISVGMLITP